MLTRRRLLGSACCAAGAAGLGMLLPNRRALADALAGSDLKFLFVVNYGGWDPTRVFATEFDNPAVDMESTADLATRGDLSYVAHADRPHVDTFFDKYAAKSVIFNGVLVSSVAHENCLRISLTGSTAQDRSDWGAILGGARGPDFALPQIVIGGPSFPGKFGAYVTRTGTGGQLEALLSGDFLTWSDTPVRRFDGRAEDAMNAYLARRTQAAAESASGGREAALKASLVTAMERSGELKDLLNVVDWSSISTFGGQAKLATQLLSLRVSRVATLSFSYTSWDTHVDNDLYQSMNFNQLFNELNAIMAQLEALPGERAATMAEETVVVVLSEMGRTPQLNSADGKDHWPYTSVLAVGPGLAGGRVIGGFDSYYYGKTIDPASGEIADDATNLSSEVVGATLLALADIDPEGYTPGVPPITAAIAG